MRFQNIQALRVAAALGVLLLHLGSYSVVAFHINHDELPFLLDRKAHGVLSWRVSFAGIDASAACSAVMAATLIMSSATAPRERSLHGRRRP